MREAIAANTRPNDRAMRSRSERIIVTPGGKPVMFFSILALIEEGDEVIYPESRAFRSTNR